MHRARHAFAIADAALAAHLDFKDGFIAVVVLDDLHVAKFKPMASSGRRPVLAMNSTKSCRCSAFAL